MTRLFLLLGLVLLAAARPAFAEPRLSANGDLFVGGGYDSNLFLQIAPTPESSNYHDYAGLFGRVSPGLSAPLVGDGYRLELRYGADFRQTIGSGSLLTQDAEGSFTLSSMELVTLKLAANAGRFDASRFKNDRFGTWGLELSMRVQIADGWRALFLCRVDRRVFASPLEVAIDADTATVAQVRVFRTVRPQIEVGARADYLGLQSSLYGADGSLGTTDLTRVNAGLEASYSAPGRFTALASLWAGTQQVIGSLTDIQVGGSAVALVRAGPRLDAVARYDFLIDRAWSDAQTDYARHVVSLGLSAHFSVAQSPHAAAAPGGDEAPLVQGRNVRFRIRAKGASRVTVVGSWNDWETTARAQRLAPFGAPGVWDTWVVLPPGTHRYRFLVDGKPVKPRDAVRYLPDGFGGEDGVVEVPE